MHCPSCTGTGIYEHWEPPYDRSACICCDGTGEWRDGVIYIENQGAWRLHELCAEGVARAFESPEFVHAQSWPLILDFVLDPVRAADVHGWLEEWAEDRKQAAAKRIADAARTLEQLADTMRGTPAHAAIETAWLATYRLTQSKEAA